MENDSQELKIKTSANKDMWLFLIVLDVIFLCVFGFFLYKHFTAKLETPAPVVEIVETETVEALPEEMTVVTQTETVEISAPEELKPEPAKEVKEEEVVPSAVPEKEPAPAAVVAPGQVVPAPVKESIVVASVPNSKYRRVTFKWFGDGKTVSIVSGFTMSKPQALKKVGDHWETTLSIAPGTYKFLYIIDGKNTRDPYAAEKDGRSLVFIK